jgi:phenylacetate-coenzyme A ligase PaaK-like adenylate-forming protein
VLNTALRQLRHATRVLTGRPFGVADIQAIVADLRASLEEFGAPGEDLDTLPGSQPADPEIQAVMARRRVRQVVRHAAVHVPYYRHWFTASGMNSSQISLEALSQIPPTAKDALRAAPSAFITDSAEPVLMIRTTGTTGTPAGVWFSKHELDLQAALTAISLMVNGRLRSHHVVASAITSRSTLPVVNSASALGMIGAGYIQLGTIEPQLVLDRLASPLHVPGKKPQITHLVAVPSYLGLLTWLAEHEGWSAADFGLEQVFAGGEVLTEALRARATEAFGAEILDGYGATEITPVAGSLCSARHLHIPAEHAHVEIADPVTLAPALPGAVGVLIVTPYLAYRDTTVLLRYNTGDLVRRLAGTEPPDCELRAIPAMSPVLGRIATDGSGLTTRDVLEVLQAERDLPMPTRYALSQSPSGPLLHVVAPGCSRQLLARLEERAADCGLAVSGIVLADDPMELPAPSPARSDLRELTFESGAASHDAARVPSGGIR